MMTNDAGHYLWTQLDSLLSLVILEHFSNEKMLRSMYVRKGLGRGFFAAFRRPRCSDGSARPANKVQF
jgi:hypothetical protein